MGKIYLRTQRRNNRTEPLRGRKAISHCRRARARLPYGPDAQDVLSYMYMPLIGHRSKDRSWTDWKSRPRIFPYALPPSGDAFLSL
jgi:hypothetical protein